MATGQQLVVFQLDGTSYALYLDDVERVVRVAEWIPLPNAPEIVLGVINVEGRVIPVLDPRRRFGFPTREVALSDQIIIARTGDRTVSLLVDRVEGVVEARPDMLTATGDLAPDTGYVDGVARLGNDIVLIHDLERFLSMDEEQGLDRALADHESQA